MSRFIKVTPRGEKESRIVLATLKSFYLAQGAKVEIPTDEEVYRAEPALRPANVPVQPSADTKRYAKQQAELEKTIAALRAEVEKRDVNIKEQAETIANLREKLAANEAALTETEAALEHARKELAKPAKKAKAGTDAE